MRRLAIFLLIAAAGSTAGFAGTKAQSAGEIVKKWRAAVHAKSSGAPATVALTSSSTEDGIHGDVQEWLTTAGDFRRVVKREFDDAEIVLTARSSLRRDWNGFVRPVEGAELSRLRTAVFESSVLAFGPPKLMLEAEVSQSDDRKLYVLKVTAPEGKPITWYVDAGTFLPVKSVHPGDDSEITTVYEDWRSMDGILTAARGKVTETDKPEYTWERTGMKREPGVTSARFAPPAPGPSDVRMDETVPPIPFAFESAHIVLQASVNGRPPIGWIFDTGADQQCINSTRLADFGLKTYGQTITTGGGGSADYGYAAGATFTFPGVELKNQHVAVIDQTGLERALGVPLGGILGYDFISRFVVEVDYDKKLLVLHDPKRWTYGGKGFVVGVTFDGGIPFTHGTISVPGKSDIPAFFVVDFGAAETMTLTSPFVKANDLVKLAQTGTTVNRSPGLENQFFTQNNVRGLIQRLKLGPLTAENIPINMSVNTQGAYASENFSGTVGESLFRRYHVFLDYARSRVIFEPTEEAAKPFPERRTYGLTVLASGADLHTYPVTGVRPDSPAEQAGFKKGDVIAAFDGKPASQFTLGELRTWLTKDGEHHEVQVTRGSDSVTIPVEVKLVAL
jgi:hypothetical protein